jgi:arabinogalactan oligomer / maltooligosaccharide transport system permease protein
MTKRRLIILGLVLLGGLLLLTGCRKENGMVRLQLWHQMLPEDRELLARVVAAYEAQHDSVIVELIYKETEELRSGFQSAALAGLGPDLIFGPSDQVGPFATMGFIKPLDGLLTEKRAAELDPRAVVKYKGHVCQIADRVGNHLTLVYNTKLIPVPPKNTDEMIRMGTDVTKDLNGDGKIDQWGIVWNFTEPFFFAPWLSGFGGWVFDDQGKPSLNTKACADAFRFVKELRDEYKIIPPDCDYNMADVLFKEGHAAMLINGPWSWPGYEKAGVPFELARIPMVTATGLWPAPMVSPMGYSICINTKGRKLLEAEKLLTYLVSDSVQRRFVSEIGVIPSSLAVRQDSSYLSRPHMAQSLSQLEVGRAMPVVPELRAVWDALRPAYQLVLGGNMSPEAAAAKAQKDAEDRIREMNE